MIYVCSKCGDEFYHSKRGTHKQQCPGCKSEPKDHIPQPYAVIGDYLRFRAKN